MFRPPQIPHLHPHISPRPMMVPPPPPPMPTQHPGFVPMQQGLTLVPPQATVPPTTANTTTNKAATGSTTAMKKKRKNLLKNQPKSAQDRAGEKRNRTKYVLYSIIMYEQNVSFVLYIHSFSTIQQYKVATKTCITDDRCIVKKINMLTYIIIKIMCVSLYIS